MIAICKRIRYADYYYVVPVKAKIIILKKEYNSSELYVYYDKIKSNRKDRSGRYMIKRVSLDHRSGRGSDLFASGKQYFCYADAGICYTFDKKDDGIFYSNNYREILRLAKLLSCYSKHYALVSIVDRKNSGKETYIINKRLANLGKDRKIFIK